MTKVIGMMCVRDEADLLPEVLNHLDGKLDELYVYEDGSQDGTAKILLESPQVTYMMSRTEDSDRLPMDRPNYHHLLERIKWRHDLENEDVWVVITMGDRFFLNKSPRQIVEEAKAGRFSSVQGVQLDFLRHRRDVWTEENDTWPNYPDSLRRICRWFKFDELCIVAYKVTPDASYLKAKYPWPRQIGSPQYGEVQTQDAITLEMPYLEHQGRRSPRAHMERMASGARWLGRKHKHYDLSTYEATMETMRKRYAPYKVFPWINVESLVPFIEWQTHELFHDPANKRWFFKGVESGMTHITLPNRTDLEE